MKNNGFTLIELLAVLVILSVIMTIIFPAVTNILKQGKETVQSVQIDTILDSTYDYTLKNTNLLPEYGSATYITLNELKRERLIDSDIKDALTKELFPEDLVISIKNVGANYNKNIINSKIKGHYLYTVESELMKTGEFNSNRPTIKFADYNTELIVINIDIGDEYIPLNYTATSIKGVNITDRVIENIIYNSKIVEEVDTYTTGVYYVNYSVVDLEGYSNSATVNIIISDNVKPALVIPDNISISGELKFYDLMEGVSCTDNSKKCNISYNGSIDYGVLGKYVIEYKASDETGNTTTKKRVITVE